MKIAYWTSSASPYMVARFNCFSDITKHDFEAWFTDRQTRRHPWEFDEHSWRFRHRWLAGLRVPWLGRVALPPVLADRPDLLISLYAAPDFLIASAIGRSLGVTTCHFVERTVPEFAPRRAWKEFLKKYALGAAEALLVPGPDAAAYAARYARSQDRVLVLHHCVDVRHIESEADRARVFRDAFRLRESLDGIVFLFVGALDVEFKGLDTLLDAFAFVRRTLADAQLLLVGTGIGRPCLEQRSSLLGLDRVRFVGFVQPEELPSWYVAADVFAFPSRGDTYGMVIDEAMASGLPVITTTAVGEAGLRIQDGTSGFLIPPSDPDALADRMIRLAKSPDLRSSMAEEGRRSIARFSCEAWARRFEQIADALDVRRRSATQ